MVDASLLLRRMATVRHCLDRMATKRALTRNEFLASPDAQDVVLRNLQVGVQAAMDISLHILRDEGWEMPGSSVGSFEVLVQHGVIDAELARRLRHAGQMRNLLVHDSVNLDRVYDAYQVSTVDLEVFCKAVRAHFAL